MQCKLKGQDQALTEQQLRKEVNDALTFRPSLSEYVIATTASDDQKLQGIARRITAELARTAHPMRVDVWGWETLQERINEHPDARRAFDPSYSPYISDLSAELRADSQNRRSAEAKQYDLLVGIQAQLAALAPVDADATTAVRLAVEAGLDARIDDLRDIGNDGQPRIALDRLVLLLDSVRGTASGRILFRITANIAICHLNLGDEEEAARLLIEAYQHAPDEPKAVANRMLADLLRGDWAAALALGRQAIERDPANEAVAGYLVQAAGRNPGNADPIDLVPEALRSAASVMVARGHALWRPGSTDRWRQVARAAVAAHPDDEGAQHLAALADLDEVLSSEDFQSRRVLYPEEREQIERAATVLHRQWGMARTRNAPPRPEHLTLCGNLAAATFMLGRGEEALEIIRQGLALAPDDEDLLVRAAAIAIEGADVAYARSLLPRLPDTPEGVILRFRLHLGTNEWPELRALLADRLGDIPSAEQTLARTVARLAALALSDATVAAPDLRAVAQDVVDDARAGVVVALFAQRQGLPEVADAAFAAAVEAARRDGHVASRLTVAHLAEDRDDWPVVADLLLGHVDESRDHPELRLLSRALVNDRPIRERSLTFFERLPAEVRDLPSYLFGLGLMHLHRGALPEAEASLRQAIAAAPRVAAHHLALFQALRGLRRLHDARDHLDGLDLASLEGPPSDRIQLAHALRMAGLGLKAISYGYDVLRSAPNDPEVAMRYVGLILVPDDGSIPMPDAVGPDTWFSIDDGAGTTLSYLIEGLEDRPGEELLSPSHPTARAAMGRRPGETFALPSSNRAWRIVEVKHKFLHAAHDVMESFEEDFPDASGFRRVSLADGDVAPALEEVRRTSEALRQWADFYINDRVPLCMVAGRMGRDTIGFADYVRSLGRDIRTCAGDLPEREGALRLIAERRASGAVLDAYTAWTAATMNALDVLSGVFGPLHIPRSALDEIVLMRDRLAPPGGDGPLLTMAWQDGRFVRQDFTVEEVRARQAFVDDQIAKIEAACKVVPSVAPDEPTDFAKAITDIFGGAVLDAANLAARGHVLVSEDLAYRATAEEATGARGVWLQAVLMAALAARIIDAGRYNDLMVGLAARRHSHLAVEARSLLRAIEQDGANATDRSDALAGFIGTPDADVLSHVNVVREFLGRAWPGSGEASLPVVRSTGRLLEMLVRCGPGREAALLAAVRFATGDALRHYIDGWIRGHFLPFGAVEEAERRYQSAAQERAERRSQGAAPTESRPGRTSKKPNRRRRS